MKKPIKLVAIVSDVNGGCQYVALVKNVDESEYATLLYEQRQQETKRKQELKSICEYCEELAGKVEKLEKEIKVLKGEDDNEQVEESIID